MPLIPVNPSLTDTGAISVLVNLLGEEGAHPVPLARGDNVLKGNFDIYYNDIDIRAAAAAKVSPIFDGEITSNSRAVYFDATTHIDKVRDSSGGNSAITNTRWGVGMRISLKVTNFDAKMKGGPGLVVASAELGLTTVMYHVQGLGLGVDGLSWVLSGFPAFGPFKTEAYARIQTQVIANLAQFIKDHANDLTPQPYAVDLASGFEANYVSEARSVLFAMRKIKNSESLDQAVKSAGDQFNLAIVRRVYDEIAPGTPSDREPPEWALERADAWLSLRNA